MNWEPAAEIKFFDLSSRIGRVRYLAYPLGVSLLAVIPVTIGVLLGKISAPLGLAVLGLTDLILFVLNIAFMVRRLHDLDKSGWWSLLMLVPLVNFAMAIYLVFFPGTDGGNNFGEPPPPNSNWAIIGALAYVLIIPAGIIAAIAIPAYVNATARAQMLEGIQLAQAAEAPVEQAVQDNNGNWPASLEAIYPVAKQKPAGRYTQSVAAAVSPDGAAFGIIATMQTTGVDPRIAGKAVELWSKNAFVWYCGPASVNPVEPSYLPSTCRITEPPPPP